MAAGLDDVLLLLADVAQLLSLVVLLYRLRWFTGGDEGDRKVAAGVSLNTQCGMMTAHSHLYGRCRCVVMICMGDVVRICIEALSQMYVQG